MSLPLTSDYESPKAADTSGQGVAEAGTGTELCPGPAMRQFAALRVRSSSEMCPTPRAPDRESATARLGWRGATQARPR